MEVILLGSLGSRISWRMVKVSKKLSRGSLYLIEAKILNIMVIKIILIKGEIIGYIKISATKESAL